MLGLLRGGGYLKIDCIIHIWAASIDPNNNYESTVSKSINEGMPSCNNFPLSRNNLCSCPSQFETDAKAWTAYKKKFWEASMCFHPICHPRCGRFFVRGRAGLELFSYTHLQVGGRNPWLIVNLFLPHPQSTYNAQSVCGHKDYRMAYFLGDQLEKVTTRWWKNIAITKGCWVQCF